MARFADTTDVMCGKGDGELKQKDDYLRCPSGCEEWEVRPFVTAVAWPREVSV